MISRNPMNIASFILCFLISSHAGNSLKVATICDGEAVYDTTSISGSLYLQNIQSLFSVLYSNASQPNGFYNYTAGEGSGGALVYGLFLCRGDKTAVDCKPCLESAIAELLGSCSNVTRAVTWYDDCMLRYSDLSIVSKLATLPMWFMPDGNNVSNGPLLRQALNDTFNQITTRVVDGDVNGKKFSIGEANYTSFAKIYAMAQCTPDISNLECENCLNGAIAYLPTCCTNRHTARVLYPSCNIRYSINPFYEAKPPPPLQSTPPPTPPHPTPPPMQPMHPSTSMASPGTARNHADGGGMSITTIAAIVSPITAAALAFLVVLFYLAKKRGKGAHNVVPKTSGMSSISTNSESVRYSFSQVQVYTKNFAVENMIGKGGYGLVYKGMLPNGQTIAVKRLSIGSTQGKEEFINELALVAKLQHKNLVRLLGYCLEGDEKILIYEFVANKSLDYFLFDREKQTLMDWKMRFSIIKGIARGLLYLHEDSRIKVIHRDMKAANILLDENMNAKIADFGIAKLFEIGQSERNTTKIAGTFGYMAPEYVSHGILSVKSDVFSFGVLVLEVVSGKRVSNLECFGADDLLTYAWKQWRDGTPLTLTDPNIWISIDKNEAIRCIHVGLQCVEKNADRRPTMDSIIMMLNSSSIPLPALNPPEFLAQGLTFSTVYDNIVPLNDSSSCSEAFTNETSSRDLYSR